MTTGGKYIIENLYEGTRADEFMLNVKLLNDTIDRRCINKPILQDLATHESYVKKYYKPIMPMAFEFQALQAETGNLIDGSMNRFSLLQYGDFQCEMILEVNISEVSTVSPLDRCGYFDFPGHRLLKYVGIDFAGNIIDEYSSDAYNVFYNYFVPEDKKISWLRAVGQEVPQTVYVQQSTDDNWREAKQVVSGHQTLKRQHGPLRMFIPIIFDMSRKLHTSLFSAKIPYGQRFLKLNLTALSDLIYVQNNGGGGALNMPKISGQLWVNHVFIDTRIKSLLLPGRYVTLMRVFKEQRVLLDQGDNLIRLDQLRYPCEHIYFGLRPTANTAHDTWWRFHNTLADTITVPVRVPSGIIPPNQLAFLTTPIMSSRMPVNELQFLSKNAEITRVASNNFYSVLMPYVKSIGPRDDGLMLHSFARDTVTDEPTSYFNISTSREFFIKINVNTAGELYILTYNWNWMIIDNAGSVTLRYKS